MLLYTLRTVAFSLGELHKRAEDPLAPVLLHSRAWPWHCDYMRHINNATYLALMDYGRTQFFLHNQLIRPMYQRGWRAVVAGNHVVYRRSIDLMRPYTLATRVLWFDERWYIQEQNFHDEQGRLAVRALVRSQLREGNRPLSLSTLLEAAGRPATSPPLTEELRAFLDAADRGLDTIRTADSREQT